MKLEDDILDRVAPTEGWKPDWTDVLHRAEAPTRRPFHFVAGRRIAVAFAAVAVLLIPVIALGADNGWWFMNADGNAVPTFSSPTVVAEGSWNGHPWQLVAVASSKLGLCRTVTPPGEQVQPGVSMSCGSMVGYVGASHPGNTAKRTVDAEFAASRLSGYPPSSRVRSLPAPPGSRSGSRTGMSFACRRSPPRHRTRKLASS